MCLAPILLKNPYACKSAGVYKTHDPETAYSLQKFAISHYKDYIHQYIYVPCGKCSQCIANKESAIIQRVELHCHFHHAFMVTLTYNNDMLRHFVTSTGASIAYADYTDIQNMFKHIRKDNALGREFSYMVVSELGSQKGRPHFHLVVFLRKEEGDDYKTIKNLEDTCWHTFFKYWRRRVGGSDKKPIYKPLFTYKVKYVRGKRIANYDCHFVDDNTKNNSGKVDVFYYLYKYLYKRSEREVKLEKYLRSSLSPDEFKDTWRTIRTTWRSSKGIGLPIIDEHSDDFDVKYEQFVADKIHGFIKLSELDQSAMFPKFYSEYNREYPLAKFYKVRYQNYDSVKLFAIRNGFNDESVAFGFRQSDFCKKLQFQQAQRTFAKIDTSNFTEYFSESDLCDECPDDFEEFESKLSDRDFELLRSQAEFSGNLSEMCFNSPIRFRGYVQSQEKISRWRMWRDAYVEIFRILDTPITQAQKVYER